MNFDPKFYPLILSGRKTCTTRLEKKAEKGEIIHYPDFAVIITSVEEIPFYMAFQDDADYWHRDGFDSICEYYDELVKYYPVLKNNRDHHVFIHSFKVIMPTPEDIFSYLPAINLELPKINQHIEGGEQ